MMKNKTLIALAILAVIVGVYVFYRATGRKCVKENGNFGTWEDSAIPHGDLRAIAEKFLPGNPDETAPIVGGFFRAINVYPSQQAAKHYEKQLLQWAKSESLSPYWHTTTGEKLCLN